MRQIKLTIGFFTDKIARPGYIKPKHAWSKCWMHVRPNKLHGIKDTVSGRRCKLENIPKYARILLKEAGVTLHEPPVRKR